MHRIQRLVGVHPSRARFPLPALGALLLASTVGAAAFAAPAPTPQRGDETRQERMDEIRAQIAELKDRINELSVLLENESTTDREGSVRHRVGRLHPPSHRDVERNVEVELHGLDENVHEHVLKALEAHGIGDDIHEHVQKALEAHGIHREHGNRTTGGLHGKHGKEHNIQIHGLENLGSLKGLENLGKVHEHVQKALEGHDLDFDFDFSGLENLKNIEIHREALEALEDHDFNVQLRGLGELKNLDKIHEHVQKALEAHGLDAKHGVHGKHGSGIQIHGLDRAKVHEQVRKALKDHDFNVEIRGLENLGEINRHILKAMEDVDFNLEIGDLQRNFEFKMEKLEDINANILKDLDRHSIEIENFPNVQIRGLEDLDENIQVHIRKALEAHGLGGSDCESNDKGSNEVLQSVTPPGRKRSPLI